MIFRNKNKIKLSTIIPVYNVEKYLANCLESVINQDLKDIEIICVNDGSTDGSLSILKEYSKIDERIMIVNQKNHGQAIARNVGLSIASGEYIHFIDSDDYIGPNSYKKLYKISKKHNTDVTIFNFIIKDLAGKTIINPQKTNLPREKVFSLKENQDYFMYNCAVWNKLFKKSFLVHNKILFQDYKMAEDILFSIKSEITSHKMIYVDDRFYYHHARENSKVQTIGSDWYDHLSVVKEIKTLAEKQPQNSIINTKIEKIILSLILEASIRISHTEKDNFKKLAFEMFPEESRKILHN